MPPNHSRPAAGVPSPSTAQDSPRQSQRPGAAAAWQEAAAERTPRQAVGQPLLPAAASQSGPTCCRRVFDGAVGAVGLLGAAAPVGLLAGGSCWHRQRRTAACHSELRRGTLQGSRTRRGRTGACRADAQRAVILTCKSLAQRLQKRRYKPAAESRHFAAIHPQPHPSSLIPREALLLPSCCCDHNCPGGGSSCSSQLSGEGADAVVRPACRAATSGGSCCINNGPEIVVGVGCVDQSRDALAGAACRDASAAAQACTQVASWCICFQVPSKCTTACIDNLSAGLLPYTCYASTQLTRHTTQHTTPPDAVLDCIASGAHTSCMCMPSRRATAAAASASDSGMPLPRCSTCGSSAGASPS